MFLPSLDSQPPRLTLHFPVNFGLRFSLKALTPSRASAVCEIAASVCASSSIWLSSERFDVSRNRRLIPPKAWVVTFAGTAVNLCLGILYAWSVWKSNLVGNKDHPAGSPMSGLDAGWTYLTDAQATWAYAVCGIIFALVMIPGGRIQDRYGPRLGATLGGLFLAGGCILAGLMKTYASHGKTALMPLPKSAAAANRCSGVGSSPATKG